MTPKLTNNKNPLCGRGGCFIYILNAYQLNLKPLIGTLWQAEAFPLLLLGVRTFRQGSNNPYRQYLVRAAIAKVEFFALGKLDVYYVNTRDLISLSEDKPTE